MPRIARIKVSGEPTVYHVMSRAALDGFVLGKDLPAIQASLPDRERETTKGHPGPGRCIFSKEPFRIDPIGTLIIPNRIPDQR